MIISLNYENYVYLDIENIDHINYGPIHQILFLNTINNLKILRHF